jgi:hypothetical protein
MANDFQAKLAGLLDQAKSAYEKVQSLPASAEREALAAVLTLLFNQTNIYGELFAKQSEAISSKPTVFIPSKN